MAGAGSVELLKRTRVTASKKRRERSRENGHQREALLNHYVKGIRLHGNRSSTAEGVVRGRTGWRNLARDAEPGTRSPNSGLPGKLRGGAIKTRAQQDGTQITLLVQGHRGRMREKNVCR